MKKCFIFAIALLFMTSFAMAANIPMVNPTGDPSPVTTVVYNAGSTIAAGNVVCWDADASTGDDKNYITTTCGSDGYNIAGVVYPRAIGTLTQGTIAIYGVVDVDVKTASVYTKALLCASGTAGYAQVCADDANAFGMLTASASSSTGTAMIWVEQVGASTGGAVNPTDGPEVWTVPVYSAGALDVGDVVVWTVDDSTGDNDYWVETTTTAETGIVAGVVFPNAIAAGGKGTIAVRGVVDVDCVSVVAGGPICASGTAGAATHCAANKNSFGHATETCGLGTGKAFINP